MGTSITIMSTSNYIRIVCISTHYNYTRIFCMGAYYTPGNEKYSKRVTYNVIIQYPVGGTILGRREFKECDTNFLSAVVNYVKSNYR